MNFAMKASLTFGQTTAGSFLNRVGDVAINLRVTEKILTEIEKRLFTTDQTPFDIEFVRTNLQKLKSLPPETSSDDFLQIEFSLDQEFNLWRGLLEERDRKIETYHLRRFFDSANQTFDRAIFIALAYFYRSSASQIAHLSKFDLVATRLYSLGPHNQREARLSRAERTQELRTMFARWDGNEGNAAPSLPGTGDAVVRLDEFMFEAETLVDFEGLIRSNIFERLRAFKRELGRLFFEPEVVAVSVESNLVLGNIFNELLTRANQNLGEKLSASFDFAGAFHDTSPQTRAHVSEILNQIRTEAELHDSKAGGQEVEHIWELLGLVSETSPASGDEAGVDTSFTPEFEQLTPSERIAPLLLTLDETEPDVRMLREYTQRSKSLWTIDLNDFIRNDEPELDRLCRDVLRVILIADELCTHELNQPKDIRQVIFDELSDVFQKSLELGDCLEKLLECHTGTLQNRLLVVSNKFLETRLRLERTIVRFSNHHLGLIKTERAEKKEDSRVSEAVTAQTAVKAVKPHRVSRWLMLVTVLVAFASGGVYFLAAQLEEFVPKSQYFE
ncbi:MAG: hypothetical protein IPJ30_04210 [Acidobacteria bacterium]|nr:hypothetical protein [Acidobacteriota bacterium]